MSHWSAARKMGNTATLQSFNDFVVVRYQIDPAVYSHVMAMVTQGTVVLIGFLHGDSVEVVAQIALPEAVDPDETAALLNGDQIEITIAKVAGHRKPA